MSHQDVVVLVVTAGSLLASVIAGTVGWALTSLRDQNVLSGVIDLSQENRRDPGPDLEAGCARRAAHAKLVGGGS